MGIGGDDGAAEVRALQRIIDGLRADVARHRRRAEELERERERGELHAPLPPPPSTDTVADVARGGAGLAEDLATERAARVAAEGARRRLESDLSTAQVRVCVHAGACPSLRSFHYDVRA